MRSLVCVALVYVGLSGEAPKPKTPPPQSTQVTPVNIYQVPPRFQMIQLGEYRADQFLLDTQTGRTWRMVKSSGPNQEEKLWEPVSFVNSDAGVNVNFNFPETDGEMAEQIRLKGWVKELAKKYPASPTPASPPK